MLVTKCDICKKTINDKSGSVNAGYGHSFSSYSFCSKCGKPVASFLARNKLVNRHASFENKLKNSRRK